MNDVKTQMPEKAAVRERVWSVLYTPSADSEAAVGRIADELGTTPLCARILYNRGFTTPAAARTFLELGDGKLHDPLLMQDMEKAVNRIERALENGEKIAIYGDYDVDGVTSVSMLYLYLESRGADVGYYIPNRISDGYGVSKAAIAMLAEKGVQLLITVDTGITAIEETAYAHALGMDVVITDHHECHAELPDAEAVVNPHRADCAYPFKELAGVGVVFKLLCASEILRSGVDGADPLERVAKISYTYADLFMLGTIADVMPVLNENRVLVAYGLRRVMDHSRLGVDALIDACIAPTRQRGGETVFLSAGEREEARKRKINSNFIGYNIAPRINAAGRMSNASIAVELLLSDTAEKAERLAQELCTVNTTRQSEENTIAQEAYEMIDSGTCVDLSRDHCIVLAGDHWHPGIVGIVASRVTDKYGLPSILFSFDGAVGDEPTADDIGKGSGRSVKGMNLCDALRDSADLLVRFGGHELAAGMSIRRGDLTAFRRRINAYAATHLTSEDMEVRLEAEFEIGTSDLTLENAQALTMLEPFGTANAIPRFVCREMELLRVIPVSGGKHTKLLLGGTQGMICAMYFNYPSWQFSYVPGDRLDILFELGINEYQNERSAQLIVQDIHPSRSMGLDDTSEAEQIYQRICQGENIEEDPETVIPNRDDFALVYTYLRQQTRQGNDTYQVRTLKTALLRDTGTDIGYIKLRFIIRVFQELQICGVEERGDGTYLFRIYYQPAKTSIEKSSILHRLRLQCRHTQDGAQGISF